MRRKKARIKKYLPDPKFKDSLVTRFVNYMMWDGKKSLAFSIFYKAMDIVGEKIKQEDLGKEEGAERKTPVIIWKEALSNIMPHVYVRSRRVGGSVHQVPVPISPQKKITLAIRWLISFSRKRKDKSMASKLAGEILLAYKGEGAAVKRKEEVHKMAESNRAYSHFRLDFNS